jgi:Pyridoxamine 5'-phosphate oxidase
MSFAMSAVKGEWGGGWEEQYLAGLHVGILGVAEAGRGPITVPVWYDYQVGGQVSVITGRDSRKARALRAAGRMTLCAQDEAPPYRYVSVEGPVVFEEVKLVRHIGPSGQVTREPDGGLRQF